MADKEKQIAEAKEILAEENARRQKAFLEDYKQLCLKHGMELIAVPQITIRPMT